MKKSLLSKLVIIPVALISTSALCATIITTAQQPSMYARPNQQLVGDPYGAQTQQQYQGSTTKDKEEDKTAYEQGYMSNEDRDAYNERIQSYGYNNTARQRGEVVVVPTEEGVGILNKKEYDMFLFNWRGRLMDRGVSAEKINFEASRLNKVDFEKWASRQVRYADE